MTGVLTLSSLVVLVVVLGCLPTNFWTHIIKSFKSATQRFFEFIGYLICSILHTFFYGLYWWLIGAIFSVNLFGCLAIFGVLHRSEVREQWYLGGAIAFPFCMLAGLFHFIKMVRTMRLEEKEKEKELYALRPKTF